MNNILDYYDFLIEKNKKEIDIEEDGTLSTNNISGVSNQSKIKILPQDETKIERATRRIVNKTIDKVCGGLKSLEKEFDAGNIKQLYDDNPPSFSEIIKKKDYGYFKIKNVDENDVRKIFNTTVEKSGSNTVGRGEVLLSCLFGDVYMYDRDIETEKTPDCCIKDEDGNITAYIEVKSAGATLPFKTPINTDNIIDNVSGKFEDYLNKYEKLGQIYFICFDNEFKSKKIW